MKIFGIDFPGYITGLLNKTFDKNNITSGRAATEDQLKAAIEDVQSSIQADTNTITTATGANGVSVTDAGTSGNHAYTIGLGNQVTVGSTESGSTDNPILVDGQTGVVDGLTNTTWNGTATTGRAATEDQLAAAVGAITDNDTITTVTAGDDINVTKSGDDYTVDLVDDYMVYSVTPNIIVTAEGDGSDNEVFYYDAGKSGLTATNNKIANFVSGSQKIQLAGTGLTAGDLSAFGNATTGVYWDASNKNLLVNGNAIVNILNGTPVAGDIEIVS